MKPLVLLLVFVLVPFGLGEESTTYEVAVITEGTDSGSVESTTFTADTSGTSDSGGDAESTTFTATVSAPQPATEDEVSEDPETPTRRSGGGGGGYYWNPNPSVDNETNETITLPIEEEIEETLPEEEVPSIPEQPVVDETPSVEEPIVLVEEANKVNMWLVGTVMLVIIVGGVFLFAWRKKL